MMESAHGGVAYPIFMTLAFFAAGAVFYLNSRDGEAPSGHLFPIALAAFVGGVLGAKLPVTLLNLRHGLGWDALLAGRTIVGGLVGGTAAVLIVKKKLGLKKRYGNALAAPIALGMAVGRIGCLLTGCCAGNSTALPWGVDFGDGVARHPTQVYEMLFCLSAFAVLQGKRESAPPGALLSGFFLAYFAFRFLEEFIRPHPTRFGLTTYQWVCAAGVLILAAKHVMLRTKERTNGSAC